FPLDHVGPQQARDGKPGGVHRQGVITLPLPVQVLGLAHPLHAGPKIVVRATVHALRLVNCRPAPGSPASGHTARWHGQETVPQRGAWASCARWTWPAAPSSTCRTSAAPTKAARSTSASARAARKSWLNGDRCKTV